MKVEFLGILANVDSSILKLRLQHGFKIEEFEPHEIRKLIANTDHTDEFHANTELMRLGCATTSKIYCVFKVFTVNTSTRDEEIQNFSINLVENYLEKIFRLCRLYKSGNVCMPITYFFPVDLGNNTSHYFMQNHKSAYVFFEPFTVTKKHINKLQSFLKTVHIPFHDKTLQLAFENFELSYNAHVERLSFLLLVVSLEIMFNNGIGEIRHQISRNTAVLLGKNKKESQIIFDEIKRFYKLRNNLIHSGNNSINEKDVEKLRYYVRECIKEINKTKLEKSALIARLNSLGFGSRK